MRAFVCPCFRAFDVDTSMRLRGRPLSMWEPLRISPEWGTSPRPPTAILKRIVFLIGHRLAGSNGGRLWDSERGR